MTINRRCWVLTIAASVVAGTLSSSISGSAQVTTVRPTDADIEVLRIRPNFYLVSGAGGNIAVQSGPDGLVLVDSGTAAAADRVVAVLQQVSAQPIRYIINSSADADHVGGNAKLSESGRSIFAMGPAAAGAAAVGGTSNRFPASILAAESVLLRMSGTRGKAAPVANAAWPTEAFSGSRRDLYLNQEGIQIFRESAAHTDGDSIVFFRASDVVVAGDVLDANRFPMIDVERGGTVQGEIDALNHVIALAVRPTPFAFEDVGTYVIPGHGRVYEQIDVVEYRDMVVIIRDIIKDMMDRGMTLDQIKAASPTRAYDRQYGSDSGSWTTSDFVEAIYKSLGRLR